MAIIARKISTSRFTFHRETKTFVAEASDFSRMDLAGRVYDDAADAGFVMVSERTGQKILCLYSGDKRDGENELLYEIFLCYDLRGRPLVGPLAGAEVKIFND